MFFSYIPIKGSWSKVGHLKKRRYGHNTILVDNEVLVVGGSGYKLTEKCSFNNNGFDCITQAPLIGYKPVLFLVDEDICE